MDDFNPYASPQPVGATQSRPPAWGPPFQSGHARAAFAKVMLGFMVLMSALDIFSNFLQHQLLEDFKHAPPNLETARANDLRHQTIVGVEVIGYILTAIAFLMWTHRVYRNLPSLGAKHLEHSPGWAVGWYFIPFANLVKPYSVTVEIVKYSDPKGIGVNARATSTSIVGTWWALYLISGIIAWFGGMAVSTGLQAKSLDGMQNGLLIIMASKAVSVVAAIVAIMLISRVDHDQDERDRVVNELAPSSPQAIDVPYAF